VVCLGCVNVNPRGSSDVVFNIEQCRKAVKVKPVGLSDRFFSLFSLLFHWQMNWSDELG